MATLPPFALPNDEPGRLLALRSFEVLAALAEPVFEEFVALAARLFQVPISLLSVVEEAEVHYPASVGLPGRDHQQPRAEALCSTAISRGQAVVYHDVLLEHHPPIEAEALRAAEKNHVRFYAGALLLLPNQRPLGTLCLVNHEPRPFTPDEQRILELLAGLVSHTLAVRHLCRARPNNGEAQWTHLSAELQEEIGALNALVRYLNARNGSEVPVSTAFLTQVEGRMHDLQGVLDVHRF
ncbi:GAF domain-containing protein [Hymenobacter rubripertinctus]|uniref:GAF domain-containing protein n=1 Tax=Hymenobacter rubripertinctus TaxID=2029981 RepID=A0A418R4J8_9BACT|nr:GAF domain-containing protein [Hymenobacter rubripertinctus]RIY12388.1 GAF domain-containing protein [Hymenobacter rubripertinctus]